MKANAEEVALVNFEIHDNILVANVELYWENHAEFLKYCESLLDSDYETIILDLSHVSFIFSAYMGTIGRLLTDAAKHNKHLTIRISSNLGWLFEMVGLERMVDIEIVP